MKQQIKAIIFDIGGVLQLGNPLFNHPNVHKFVAKKIKIHLDQYFDAIDDIYAKSVEGKVSEKKALEIMSRNIKISPLKLRKLYMKAYKKYYVLNKELLEVVFNLRKQGYKIAILSDQWWISKKALVVKSFLNFFNPVIISCDVKMRKPNPKIYPLILKKMNLKPYQAVFIDNQDWNLKPAKKLGMKTILFKNNKQTIKELKKMLR